MKIYVINLDKDVDRLNAISRQLESFGLSWERIPAIYGKDYKGGEYDENGSRVKNGRTLSFAELGCALSHKRAYQKFLETEDEYALILEDDVIFTEKIDHILKVELKKNSESDLRDGWEFLQFDYHKPGLYLVTLWIRELIRTIKMKHSLVGKLSVASRLITRLPALITLSLFEAARNALYRGPVTFYRNVYLAGAYVIHREGARILLSNLEKIVYPADRIAGELKKQKKLKVKYYCPLVVYQDRKTFASNIGPGND
jgi:GR25 family glycosyltransferase involved in LPS biosynthesis